MPLGRTKTHVPAVDLTLGEPAFVIRAPTCGQMPSLVETSWLLYSQAALPLADETIELWGDGVNTGYQLEYLTTGAFRFTTYGSGGGTVTTSNAVVVGQRQWQWVRASFADATLSVALGDTVVTAGGGMLAALAAEDRFLCAADLVGSSLLRGLSPAACTVGVGTTLANVNVTAIRKAQRLLESAQAISYVDFGRYRVLDPGVPGAHWGDDVTGARVESLATSLQHRVSWYRADRSTDWNLTP